MTPVSPEDMIEIANLRVLLECHAAKLSVEKGDEDWEANLVAAHHKLHRMEKRMLAGEAAREVLETLEVPDNLLGPFQQDLPRWRDRDHLGGAVEQALVAMFFQFLDPA